MHFGDAAGQDVRGGVQHLKGQSRKVGVTGFVSGGALTLLSAVNVPEADEAVVWHGFPPLEYVDATKIKAPLLGHYAIEDVPFPIATVDLLEQKLRAANVRFEFHRADVSFRNKEARVSFDPARVTVEQMIEAVGRAGFHASLKATKPTK